MAANNKEEKNAEKLRQAKQICLQLLRKHLLFLSYLQSEVFDALRKEESERKFDFFNSEMMATHIFLSKRLICSLKRHKPHDFLQRAYLFWTEHLGPAILRSTSEEVRLQFADIPKLLASYLLVSGEYDKAAVCLAQVIRLNGSDISSRYILPQWLCYLGDWELAKAQLEAETELPEIVSENYVALIDILRTIVEFNLSADKEKALARLLERERSLLECKTKTFFLYQCQAFIKQVLLTASRLPNANLAMIGDPLKNLEVQLARLQVLVKNRHRSFFETDKAYDAQKMVANVDEFLRLCSNIAEYFELGVVISREYFRSGVVREAESNAMNLWKQALRIASLPRTLTFVNILLQIAYMSSSTIVRKEVMRSVAATLLNPCDEIQEKVLRSDSLSSATGSPLIVRSSCASMLNALCIGSKEEGNSDEKENDSPEIAGKVIKAHKEECACVVCELRRNNVQFTFEVHYTATLFENFASNSFRSLAIRFEKLPTIIFERDAKIREAMQMERSVKCKHHHWIPIRELFLSAAARWLRDKSAGEKLEIGKEVITKSLKICDLEPWHHCWQRLTIRQFARCNLGKPDLSWLEMPGSRKIFAPIVDKLASDLNAVSLQTPRRATPLRSGRSRTTPSKTGQNSVRGRKPVNQKAPLADEEISASLEEALDDFIKYSHLFYREWRYPICTYLGQLHARCRRDPWAAAFFFAESVTLGTRQIARSISEDDAAFHFESVDHFKSAVQDLPNDLTVVQLFLDAHRILWIVRLHSEGVPLIVPVAALSQEDDIIRRLNELLEANDESGKLSKTCTDAKKFWQVRRNLDKTLESIVKDMERVWLREFAPLLLPCCKLTSAGELVAKGFADFSFSKDASIALAESVEFLSNSECRRLVERLGEVEGLSESDVSGASKMVTRWKCSEKKKFVDRSQHRYSLLSISPELASFPFEMLPIFESQTDAQRVARITSFYFFHKLLIRSKQIPKSVDGRNTYYVLDPGGDLAETQNRLAKLLQKYKCWKGIIGKSPKPEELRNYIETNDLFFYMGHGSGGRYFGKTIIRRSDCRAVSVLMGCSSAKISVEGEGFDGRSAVYDYSMAKCPCLVGCLWMVTDGEIDRFFMAFMSYCFSDMGRKKHESNSETRRTYRLLIDGMAHARTACKLRYMTGGAVVSYGLPIVAQYEQLL